MKKVLFVNLTDYVNSKYSIDCLGILSLATILKDNYDVEVIDFQYIYNKNILNFENDMEKDMPNMKQYILNKKPDLICIYTMCNTYHLTLVLSKAIKEYDKNIKIILGGPQASLTATETLAKFPWIDAIGVGEGEKTIEYMVGNLLNNIPFKPQKGIAYLDNGVVQNGGIADVIEDLDTLKYIDYSFLPINEVKVINIDVGRGCPFGCSFCSTKTFWSRKFRLKTPKRIVNEINYYITNYNIRNFSFTHDLFTFNKRLVLEFCDLLLKESIDIKWTCSSRVDTLDDETIEKMATAGCTHIFLGVETGSKILQKKVGKNLDLTKVYPITKKLSEVGIKATISFIYGFPEETEEDLKDTLTMITQLNSNDLKSLNTIQLHRLTFFAGTEMTKKYLNQLTFSENRCSTMINETDLTKYQLDVILNNKEIFPQYFDYATDLRNKSVNLEKFVFYIYLTTYKHFRYTYMFILDYYKNDILKFFYNFKEISNDTLDELTFFNQGNIKILFTAIESLKTFINAKDFGQYSDLVREVFKFEYYLFSFMHSSTEKEKIVTFNKDIYNLIKNKQCQLDNKHINLKFTRTRDKINISKI